LKVGIIGAGELGTALAKRLQLAGHSVTLSFSRDPTKLAEAAARLALDYGTPREAVERSDVVALVAPWLAIDEALGAAGPLDGKIVWDCTNPINADFSGLAVGTNTSGAEIISRKVPHAHFVKGIPPFARVLAGEEVLIDGQLATSFICGDDADAKNVVRTLLEALPVRVVDVGPLTSARFVEPAGFLLVLLAFALGHGQRIGFDVLGIPQSPKPTPQ
jgi:8-hydroxy-5-deazaflavin:NADPH oxidoreductase